MPIGRTVVAILLITAVPLLAGMALRHFFHSVVRHIAQPTRHLATAVFAAIVVSAFWGQWADIERNWPSVGPAVVLLNLATMSLGFCDRRCAPPGHPPIDRHCR